jgi:hypothetical protein
MVNLKKKCKKENQIVGKTGKEFTLHTERETDNVKAEDKEQTSEDRDTPIPESVKKKEDYYKEIEFHQQTAVKLRQARDCFPDFCKTWTNQQLEALIQSRKITMFLHSQKLMLARTQLTETAPTEQHSQQNILQNLRQPNEFSGSQVGYDKWEHKLTAYLQDTKASEGERIIVIGNSLTETPHYLLLKEIASWSLTSNEPYTS